ncbi:CPBP family intramembrane metalloprotease [Kribbella sandramycini]|uniref:CPBP family intramembrane metalloprotease n=1 Tax=Kribbella sandramycini TaxID=60450 RepID=A0A7Y4P1J4_9ACTN|nr:type II CAAX endopeptidase family protein [Kribbella sandramycini]MBB6566314.1 membrane protease YdiL (CAAX protease family) [Kribbella sandramycini]NOL43023.1 CPBP family intramembrane metalloprotease [Kribbella sandramycini]
MTTAYQTQQHVESVGYERLARVTGRHNWWRPIVGTVVLLVLFLFASVLVLGQSALVGLLLKVPFGDDELPMFDDLTSFGIDLLAIAIAMPALALTLWWVQRRTWGSITSVTGRLRLPWLARCLAVAGVLITLMLTTAMVTGGGPSAVVDSNADPDSPFVGIGPFLLSLVVLMLLVPLQAAAEEFIFRGWLLQAVGSFVRWPVLVVIPQAFLFAAAHGWGTPWGFAALTVFGLALGWLTIRTGGIEAAIALHVANNLIAMLVSAAYKGGLASEETAADLPWEFALLDMGMVVVFVLVILRLAKRYNPARLTPAGARI